MMSSGDDRLDDPLLRIIESILVHDIPDENRRYACAMIIKAHVRSEMVRLLRDKFNRFIGIDGVAPTPHEALEAMRGAIVCVAGFDSASQVHARYSAGTARGQEHPTRSINEGGFGSE
jgi:hypothetical protein